MTEGEHGEKPARKSQGECETSWLQSAPCWTSGERHPTTGVIRSRSLWSISTQLASPPARPMRVCHVEVIPPSRHSPCSELGWLLLMYLLESEKNRRIIED